MSVQLVVQALLEPGEGEPMSFVFIDCTDHREAQATATFLRGIQNGEATLRALGDSVLFGDSALKLSFPLSERTPDRVRVVLRAQRSSADLTDAIYLQTEIDREAAELFRYFHGRRRSYALTMSVAGVPQMDMLYLAKYVADYPWRPRLQNNDVPMVNDAGDVMKLAGLTGYDQRNPQ